MKIWVVVIGEPLPTDGDKSRLHRGGQICELLAQAGHNVIWWSSTYNHAIKKFRSQTYTEIKYKSGLQINLLHGCHYQSNVSYARLKNHSQIADQFISQSRRYPQPDLIFCAMPTIELSLASVSIGQQDNLPVVLDMRDMWPDIFLDALPSFLRPLGQLAIRPLKLKLRKAAEGATAIMGITPGFVNWGLKYAGRSANSWDRHFPLAYSSQYPTKNQVQEGFEFWDRIGVSSDPDVFNICFFGSMGRQINLDTVIKAARQLREEPQIKFILCGDGDRLNYFKRLAHDCSNVLFPGWMDSTQIWTLMRRCKAGLAPYKNKIDFQISYPNKPIEYLSAGLPVLSSLRGDLEALINNNQCGLTYEEMEPDDLVKIIEQLKTEPNSHLKMSQAAHNLYIDKFQSEKVYTDLIRHLDALRINFIKDHHVRSKRN